VPLILVVHMFLKLALHVHPQFQIYFQYLLAPTT